MSGYNFFQEIFLGAKALIPEISILLAILINIVILFFNKNKKSFSCIISSISILLLGAYFSFVNLSFVENHAAMFFDGMYVVNRENLIFKLLVILAVIFVHIFSLFLSKKNSFISKFAIAEISILINFSTLGALAAISANNFITLYLALELQALASYILVAIKRQSNHSVESALKYFVLGVLASSFLLFGISLIYFSFESFSFDVIYNAIINQKAALTGAPVEFSKIGMIGIIFVVCGLFFKLSTFPFHSWLADVYQGANNFVIAFFGVVPKIMAAYVLFNLYHFIFPGEYMMYNQKIISAFAFLSLIFGSITAITQKNFKRLLAYSGVANSGFILIAILGVSQFPLNSLFIYFFAYMIAFYGLVSFAMFYWSEDSDNKENYLISHMHGVAKKYPIESMMVAFCLFSIAGIPPFVGFIGKFNILMSGFSNLNIGLIVTALISSLISLIYYLNLLKVMYFANYEKIEHNPRRKYRIFLIFFGSLTLISVTFFIFDFFKVFLK